MLQSKLTGLSTSTEKLQTREYSSSTEDITSQKAESRQVSPPPTQWDSENEALSNREVYGTPDFDTDENTKKKFLRRNIEGEIIKIPPK